MLMEQYLSLVHYIGQIKYKKNKVNIFNNIQIYQHQKIGEHGLLMEKDKEKIKMLVMLWLLMEYGLYQLEMQDIWYLWINHKLQVL